MPLIEMNRNFVFQADKNRHYKVNKRLLLMIENDQIFLIDLQ